MTAKKLIIPMLLALLAAVPAGSSASPTVVGTDDAGDFGRGTDPDLDPAIAMAGAEAGMDLISASVEGLGDAVRFTIGVTSLPESGGIPESPRYVWNLRASGKEVELEGKFTNYSRGTCDPTGGACPPPRDPGEAPFLVRGNCVVTGDSLKTCEELALLHGTFDPATATLSVDVPMEFLGCEIAPGEANIADAAHAIVAIPSAFLSSSGFPKDSLLVTETANVC